MLESNLTYEVAIIGAGAMGAATAWHLSRTGKRILVIDRFEPPHNFGSSHGESRIIREAYFESPMYVKLVQQAYAWWDALEKESGKKLFLKTGGLMLGSKERRVFQGATNSAMLHHVPYEFLDAAEIKKRFPVFKSSDDTMAVYEHNAGILFPEECIRTEIDLAKKDGVNFHFHEKVIQIVNRNDIAEIITNKSRYSATKVIVSAGAWVADLFPELNLPLHVNRQVLFWFRCKGTEAKNFQPQNFPIYVWEYEENKIFYGFPDLGGGLKIAIHHQGLLTTADSINREVKAEEIGELAAILHRFFNGEFEFDHAAVCMYTNTDDEDFIIDYHPTFPNIIIVSACSGHGFKFSSAIGKILSDMVTDQPLSFDISVFTLKRLMK